MAVNETRLSVLRVKSDGFLDYSGVILDLEDFHKPYDFEKIDWASISTAVHKHRELPFIASAIYVALIFGIQRLMRDRKPFDLRYSLFLWNAALGLFSLLGFSRLVPVFFHFLTWQDGIYTYVCKLVGASSTTLFWGIAFGFSKYVELGDTIFIVLRKRPLQFLQWYHHVLTLIAVNIAFPYGEPLGRVFAIMNYGVHSVMYPYFALRAINVKIPRWMANVITTLQLAQMIIGLFANIYTASLYESGGESSCYRNEISIQNFNLLYGSFVILFGKLFYDIVLNFEAREKKKIK